MAAAFRKLSARQRVAVVLRYYSGLSEAEIASAMGISEGSATLFEQVIDDLQDPAPRLPRPIASFVHRPIISLTAATMGSPRPDSRY